MHELRLDNWIYFANHVLDLHDRRLASAYETMDVILPMPGLSDHVVGNFQTAMLELCSIELET